MNGGLRIVFDPAIDGGACPGSPGRRVATVGEAWLGPLGLLDRLETELGLGGLRASPTARACRLAAQLVGRTGWWRASYEADPIGTCKRLLRDRDTLALWGWRGEAASDRLAELWAATADAPPGLPDRLRDVRAALMGRRIDLEAIEVMSPVATLPPAWAALFAQIGDAAVRVTEVHPTTAVPSGDLALARAGRFVPRGDGSLTILRPHGPLAAADEIAASLAALTTLDGVVIIGGDEVLGAALGRHGLPCLGAAAPPPASSALIRLVIEAAFEPMEPSDLHALLCLDPGPVPRRVAYQLIGALKNFPGRRSELWRDAMADGLACCDASWRRGVGERLSALLMPVASRDGTIAATEICRRLQIVATWARSRAEAMPTLWTVARLASDASALIELFGATELPLTQLYRLCDELEDDSRTIGPADAGLAAVAGPGAVLAPAEVIVWWGFTRDSAPTLPRLRLSLEERRGLARLRVTPPDTGALMEAEAARWRRPLEMASRALVLVCPTTDEAGAPSFPHPLWDELRAAMPQAEDAGRLEVRRLQVPAAARRKQVTLRGRPTPGMTIRTGTAIALREQESPSSLERLIGCSLAWALHYHARLQPGISDGPPAPSPLLYGKLAHHLLAQVFGAGALSPEEAASRAETIVDAELPGLCESLALPRYQVERTHLKQVIVDSARELGAFLIATGATVRGVELEASRTLAGIAVAGTADMVLSTPDVILDLKWGRTSNREKLATGTALQLAMYAELHANGSTRHEVAYFALNSQELFGEPGSVLPGVQIPGKATARDTWHGTLTTLARRRTELADGILVAPAADRSDIKPRLDGEGLHIAPGCDYCALGGLCGRAGCV